MEKQIIKCRIDVSKIDKKRLHKGEKGIYCDFTLIENRNEYSDFMIVEDITADERKGGKKGTILGNAKNVVKNTSVTESDNDNIPF